MEGNIDDIIINTVREHQFIYAKSHAEYKRTDKRKEFWRNFATDMQDVYCYTVSGDVLEKRWSSLRDMFSREHRKKKSLPSGSGADTRKEWPLYNSLIFLIPHIISRPTKSNFTITTPSSGNQGDHDYIESSIDDQLLDAGTSDSAAFFSPSAFSTTTGSSVDSLAEVEAATPNRKRKQVPEAAVFSKKRSTLIDHIEKETQEVNVEFSNTLKEIKTFVVEKRSEQQEHLHRPRDGYMAAIDEGLSRVPLQKRTQCIIELLQVILKYEKSEEKSNNM